MAIAPSGNFVVTWSSFLQDGSGYGIFGQRYDATGATVGDEFQVNTFTSSNQIYPSSAIDPSGNFVVVWSSFSQDGSGYGIFGQRYSGPAAGGAGAAGAAGVESGSITITNLLDGTDESLAVDTTGTNISALYNAATGVLALTGTDTLDNYQTVLRTATYNNASQDPDSTSRIIEFLVDDGDGIVESARAVTTLTVIPVNDLAVVSSADEALNETDAPVSTGGTLTSMDVDNLDNTFTPSNTAGAIGSFAIDVAGAWTFTANSPFDSLNVGDNVNETYNVTSVDGTPSTVKITITGTNDAAVVSNAEEALDETDAPLSTGGTLTSTDVDNPDNTFTPSNTTGAVDSLAIDSTGAWTFTANSAYDSLNVGDNVNETYDVTSVDGTSSTVMITIHGTNDAAVVSSDDVELIETDTPLSTSGTLTSTDVDNPDNTFTPSNTAGAIGSLAIDAAGAWTFTANSPFDSLNVGDNVNETYNVTSVDGTPSTVKITITGTNDAAVVSSADTALNETDAPVSTGGTLTSMDVDNPDNTFTPSNTAGAIGSFAIDAAGAWTFTANSPFDSLNVGDNVNETYNVTSVDGTPSTVKITITGTNDAAVVSSAEEALNETDALVATGGTLTSTDVDNLDNAFTPSNSVGAIGTLLIDAAGAWTFTANSPFDSLNVGDNVNETYNVTSVDGTLSTVKITITGTNDAAVLSSDEEALNETDALVATGGTLTSTDVDNLDNTFTPSNTAGAIGSFAMDAAGAWTFTANSPFDSLNVGDNVNETYNVTSVDGTPSTVKITITGTNDAPEPPVDTDLEVNNVAEGTAAGATLGVTADAFDIDSTTLQYTLSNDAGGRFQIDVNTGVVTVADGSLLNFEDSASHDITVVANDLSGEANATSTQMFTITVSNVGPTQPDDDDAANEVAENSATGTTVGVDVSSTDPNGTVAGGNVTFSLSDSAGGRFKIDANTGVVAVDNGSLLDFETATSHNITVVANDRQRRGQCHL